MSAQDIIENLESVLDDREDTYEQSAYLQSEFLGLLKPFELRERSLDGVIDAVKRMMEPLSLYYKVLAKKCKDAKGEHVSFKILPTEKLNARLIDELNIDFSNGFLINEAEEYGLKIKPGSMKVRLLPDNPQPPKPDNPQNSP
jgi:hypothetical protein